MALTAEHITYPGPSGPVRAYLAVPDGEGPWPGLIVIQEMSGLDTHIEEMALRFARDGYLAVAPDLYSHDAQFKTLEDAEIVRAAFMRGRPDLDAALGELPPEQREGTRRAIDWLNNRDSSTYLPDLEAALAFLQGRSDCTGAVGAIGYCMGGGLVGQLAGTGADLKAGVIFYGGNPPKDVIPNIRCPIQGHYGTADRLAQSVPDLEATMKENGKDFTAFLYEGAPHVFNNDLRPWFHVEAARLSRERTAAFLSENLH